MSEARTFEDLRDSGLLWLINRTVFHPRGFGLALVYREGELAGWSLEGDGREAWQYGLDENIENELFEAAQRTLAPRPLGVEGGTQ